MPDMRKIRRSKIKPYVKARRSRILEIGALDYPTYEPGRFDVKFIDYACTDELAKKGERDPHYRRDRIVEVDYVCPTPTYSQTVDQQFDLVIANHVIEHIPDTIRWLEELNAILVPGGHVLLSVPDKRYTFDIMRRNSTFIDLLRNYEQQVERPNFYQILEHFYYHKQISAEDVWKNKHRDKLAVMRYTTKQAVAGWREHPTPPHPPQPSPHINSESFKELVEVLDELGKFPFEVLEIGEPARMTNEFHVVLRK
jgi:SAM-dependent methyltransferase